MGRFHSLDGLRAVAATLVVAHHLAGNLGTGILQQAVFSITQSGVELFFVLSGAVLARKYIRQGVPFQFGGYLKRRAERLWPPYLVAWLFAGGAIFVISSVPTWWSVGAALPDFVLASWLSQVAILNWWSAPYSFAWWSLTIEVVFYLAVPFLILAFKAATRRPIALEALFVGTVAVSLLAFDRVGMPVLGNLINYASCFAGGLVLAARDLRPALRYVLLTCGFIVVGASLFSRGINPHVGWGLVYLGVISQAMDQTTALSRVLSANFPVWLGERSYSLFLTHYTVIALACWSVSLVVEEKGLVYFLFTRSIAMVLSVLVAMAVFTLVERRFALGLSTADQFWPWTARTPRLSASATPAP